MILTVDYKNDKGTHHECSFKLSSLALAKHLAVSGQGFAPTLNKLNRTLGIFLHYSNYLNNESLTENRFSLPPDILYDPTEKGQFSNLVGKAIADFLSKRIDKSIVTINYEAAMKILSIPITGSRPDLLTLNGRKISAIEAKGHSGVSGDMLKHKRQACSGKISVDFCVACVSYNIYDDIKVKYYDPHNNNNYYDTYLYKEVTKKYYKGLLEYLNDNLFNYETIMHNNEKFFEIKLFSEKILEIFPYLRCSKLFNINPKLLLPYNIRQYAEHGLPEKMLPFVMDNEDDKKIYIDYDRVGLSISNH